MTTSLLSIKKGKGSSSINNYKRRETIMGYSFILPAVVLIIAFLLVPFVLAFVFSLTKFNILRPDEIKFIGFENYKTLFTDPLFYKSLFNTMYFTAIVVPYQCTLALILALLINNNFPFRNFFRIAYFSPVITSMTVIAILWIILYNPNQGLINSFLHLFGIENQPFLRSKSQAMNSIIFMSAWQAAGYQMMIFLAGLQNIPKEMYEASSIDGANKIQQFRYVTLPGLYNVTIFVLMITTIQAVKLFVQPYIMTFGGPEDTTRTLALMIYQVGFQFRNVGYAASISVVFFLLVVLISLVMKRFLRDE
jgi:fructooligosaccharide transport system permease protein